MSATRTLTVQIVGDAKSGQAALDTVAGKVDNVDGKTSKLGATIKGLGTSSASAFHALGGNFGELESIATETFAHIGEAWSQGGIDQKLLATGTAVQGAGAALTAFGHGADTATAHVKTAIDNAGGSWGEYKDKVEEAVSSQEKYGQTTSKTEEALARLTTGFGSPDEALKNLSLTEDIAKARHISLADAADLVVKVHAGSTKVLKQFGIDVKSVVDPTKDLEAAEKGAQEDSDALAKAVEENKLKHMEYAAAKTHSAAATEELRLSDQKLYEAQNTAKAGQDRLAQVQGQIADGTIKETSALDLLRQKTKGYADGEAQTLVGRLEAMKAKSIDFAEHLGQKFGPAITAAGTVLQVAMIAKMALATAGAAEMGTAQTVAAAEVVAADASMDASSAVTAGFFGTLGAAAGAMWVAITGPVGLVIAAVLAVVAIGILLWKNWDTITQDISGAWHGMVDDGEALFHGVEDFFRDHWRLLLAIATGGVGLVVDYVSEHWHGIVDGAEDMGRDVVGFFEALPGRMLGALGDLGGLLWGVGGDIVQGLINGIESMGSRLWSAVTSFISRNIPGPVKAVLGIFSPSTVFHGFGQNIAEGLIGGMASKESAVAAGSGRLGAAALPPGPSGGLGSFARGAGAVGGVGSTTVNVYVAGLMAAKSEIVDAIQAGLLQKQRRVSTLGLS